jgi:hypothetical protein
MNLGNIIKPVVKKPASLSEWLDTATQGLAAPGRERVTQEIEAHFAEAVEAHVTQGQPEQTAHAIALEELGDPDVSAKSFRKRHLTLEEARRLVDFRSRNDTKTALATNFFFGLFVIYLAAGQDKPPRYTSLFCILVFLGLIVCPLLVFCLLRLPAIKSNLYSLVWVDLVQRALLGFAGVLLFAFMMPLLRHTGWAGLCVGQFVVAGIFAFKIRKKIRKNENPTAGNSRLA